MERKKPLISIIIPVYNTQDYLEECMESVLAQDYPALEIILVDDGSTDGSAIMCDAYEKQYAQVSVIHQKNRGSGLSRNAGMRIAKGEYICFLDADDRLDGSTAISRMEACACKKGADIVAGGYRRFSGDQVSAVNVTHLKEGNYTKTTDFRFQGFFRYGHLAYNWGKLYRKAFLTKYNLQCKAYSFTQDKAHNMECCACEPVYAFLNESVCLYRVNEQSVSFRYKKDLIPVWIAIASDFEKSCKKRGITKDYRDLCAFHIFFGSFYLVKQELQQYGLRRAERALYTYHANPYVRKYMKQLAKGKYVNQIHAGIWRYVIQSAAVLFSMHGFWLYALGIDCLLRFHVDGMVTKSRYRESVHRLMSDKVYRS